MGIEQKTLGEWMDAKGETLDSFAVKVGASAATVSRWRSGQSFPRRKALERISAVTGGAVTAASFMADVAKADAA